MKHHPNLDFRPVLRQRRQTQRLPPANCATDLVQPSMRSLIKLPQLWMLAMPQSGYEIYSNMHHSCYCCANADVTQGSISPVPGTKSATPPASECTTPTRSTPPPLDVNPAASDVVPPKAGMKIAFRSKMQSGVYKVQTG